MLPSTCRRLPLDQPWVYLESMFTLLVHRVIVFLVLGTSWWVLFVLGQMLKLYHHRWMIHLLLLYFVNCEPSINCPRKYARILFLIESRAEHLTNYRWWFLPLLAFFYRLVDFDRLHVMELFQSVLHVLFNSLRLSVFGNWNHIVWCFYLVFLISIETRIFWRVCWKHIWLCISTLLSFFPLEIFIPTPGIPFVPVWVNLTPLESHFVAQVNRLSLGSIVFAIRHRRTLVTRRVFFFDGHFLSNLLRT